VAGPQRVEICNKRGLHARAAAKFVKTVAAHEAAVTVCKHCEAEEVPSVSGSSILGLMMLGADQGSVLILTAEGPQASEVIAALKELIENQFGEGE
jgi:phosphocarrier protein HPr